MNLYENAVTFTASFILMVISVLLLRYLQIIKTSDAPLISRLTINFVLPALLFSKLIFVELNAQALMTCVGMVFAEFLVGCVSLLIGKHLLHLPKRSLGVFILCSTFGSTAILGTAFITAIFKGDDPTIAYALMVAELSNGIPGYIFLYVISKRYGDGPVVSESIMERAFSLLKSPPISAIILSLAWSALKLPTEGLFITPIIDSTTYIGSGLVLMIALMNGLALAPIAFRENIVTVVLCASLVLVIKPLIAHGFNLVTDVPLADMRICLIESAMPSANAVIAYAIRYKCDEGLAAILVTSTAILGALSLPALMHHLSIFA